MTVQIYLWAITYNDGKNFMSLGKTFKIVAEDADTALSILIGENIDNKDFDKRHIKKVEATSKIDFIQKVSFIQKHTGEK